jgi:hypothetical protein
MCRGVVKTKDWNDPGIFLFSTEKQTFQFFFQVSNMMCCGSILTHKLKFASSCSKFVSSYYECFDGFSCIRCLAYCWNLAFISWSANFFWGSVCLKLLDRPNYYKTFWFSLSCCCAKFMCTPKVGGEKKDDDCLYHSFYFFSFCFVLFILFLEDKRN